MNHEPPGFLRNVHRAVLVASAAFLILGATTASAAAYFLSWDQKGQLLREGRVHDEKGNVYNVRIIPGYAPASASSAAQWRAGYASQKRGFSETGEGLIEIPLSLRYTSNYASPEPYEGMAEGLDQAWRWEKFLFGTFMGSEVTRAWSVYMNNARKAHEKQSFGWWFAYPWATIKGSVNSTIRVAVGVPASIVTAGYGLVGRPAYELIKPVGLVGYDAGKGLVKVGQGVGRVVVVGTVVEQVAGGTVLPLLAVGWTTSIGAPMAALGRAPRPRSTDGWWVVMLPESPDYDQSLDEDSRLRLENFGEILRFELDKHRFNEIADSLRTLRDSALKELNRASASVRDEFTQSSNSLRSEILGERQFQPDWNRVKRLTNEEREHVRKVLAEKLAGSSYYEGLSGLEREKLLDAITSTWGSSILATPKRELVSPFDKTGPNTILEEEAGQIFK